MRQTQRVLLIFILILGFYSGVSAQNDRVAVIERQLDLLADSLAPGLNEKVLASVSDVSASEFIRGLAISNRLNISIDPALKTKITVNFSEESVLNILMFLVKQYNIDIQFTGSIIYITQYVKPEVVIEEQAFVVTFDSKTQLLDVDVRNDSLFKVVKAIVDQTGQNIIISPELNGKQVSLFVKKLPLGSTLEKLAFANEMEVAQQDDGTYQLRKANAETIAQQQKPNKKDKGDGKIPVLNKDFYMTVARDANGVPLIDIKAVNTPIIDLVKVVSQELDVNHFITSEPTGRITINVTEITYADLLNRLLQGTDHYYMERGAIYLIGKRVEEGLTSAEVLPLQHRTTDVVIENIPKEIMSSLEVRAFPELNSLIVSGPTVKVDQLKAFIKQIDKIVPVVMIEVLIVDVNSNRLVSTGLKAGISSEPVETSGTIFPGVDVTVGSGSINNILNVLTGKGLINLGQVAPEFYVSMQLLEEQGILKVRSTPRLATLNGHEASMSIGKTDFYVEETNNIIGTQNPQTVVTRTYKPIKADFSITIDPVVSNDDQVTLSIVVEQSDFTSRISSEAPPGSSTRSFSSLIRVKSDEMIVLGGLEEDRLSDSGSGFPILSRIPIIKWFFSSRQKQKSRSRMSIFIKPTVIY